MRSDRDARATERRRQRALEWRQMDGELGECLVVRAVALTEVRAYYMHAGFEAIEVELCLHTLQLDSQYTTFSHAWSGAVMALRTGSGKDASWSIPSQR